MALVFLSLVMVPLAISGSPGEVALWKAVVPLSILMVVLVSL